MLEPETNPVAETATADPTPRPKKPVAKQETASIAVTACPFCGGITHAPRSDGIKGYECPECESVFLGTGKGATFAHGVLSELNETRNLAEELAAIKDDGFVVDGPFRGNAQLFQISEITLPTISGVVIAARKLGLHIQSAQPLFLTKE